MTTRMNALEQWLAKNQQVRPERVMDALQEEGLISDECVWPADVAPGDAGRAVEWLERNHVA